MGLMIDNVSKIFGTGSGRIHVLDRISLNIDNGEFICIIGPSGCGKSTLLNIIAGLDKASEGRVLLNGREISRPGIGIGIIFQELALFPWLTVIENIEFGLRMVRIRDDERKTRSEKYLNMVNLADFRNSYLHQLSGGMKQRVAIARALALDSEVLLMDEPFAALDNQTRENLQLELLEIVRQTSKTIIFVTHNIQEALFLADRIVIMTALPGRIKAVINVELEKPMGQLDDALVNKEKILSKILQEEETIIAE